MRVAFIMRGVPGSGKSTIAKVIVGKDGIIHCTDDLRMKTGKYVFDPVESKIQHRANFRYFCRSLRRKLPVVICDNTNIRWDSFKKYIRAAQNAGYLVAIVTIPHPTAASAARRTSHNVPIDVIKKMINDWQPW